MKIKRAGLYVRVSTEDQRTDSQERHLNEYVERRGWRLHKIYRDKMSGATTSRPGLDELLKDCRRRAIDVVVVWKFDRFARSLKSLISGLELSYSFSAGCQFPRSALNRMLRSRALRWFAAIPKGKY